MNFLVGIELLEKWCMVMINITNTTNAEQQNGAKTEYKQKLKCNNRITK